MRWHRPSLSTETLMSLGIAYVLLACNGGFWRSALAGRPPGAADTWVFAAALMGLLAGLYFLALAPLATRRTVRPLLALLIVAASACAWYIDHYAVYFDRAMLRNVLATHWSEARELLNGSLAAHVLLFGLLPAALLWWPRLAERRWQRALALRLAWAGAAAVLAVGSVMPVFADFASLMRNHREVRHLVTPGNVVAASIGTAWGRSRAPVGPRQPVGADAHLAPAWEQRQRPTLFVLVVGETARARNFSLDGYPRPTNPELARRDVINFPDAWSCGTSTEVSLPCMFSPFGRRHYDEDKIRSHESLLHVLARARFQVQWRDNQSGCKGVCDGLPQQALDHAAVEGLCPEGQCFDEVLLHGMDRVLADAHGNLFIVMHQLGSHGPSYYRRYPAAFKRFSPACESDDLRLCSADEIRNAYDNSLLYTDHFLARVIDFLAARQDRFDTAMLYLSDHGESLGEGGLYLHGMPQAIAPDTQRHVPMLAWLSPAFRAAFGVDADCLRARAAGPVSHDHLFHSVLGLLDVATGVYDASLDVSAACRRASATPSPNPPAPASAL